MEVCIVSIINDVFYCSPFFTIDTLTAYGTYNFKIEACSHENECSWAEISLLAAQSTTMCEVDVESYVELEMVGHNPSSSLK